MYYSNVYSGAIYYGNNDYRDYIAHSRGPWKEHLYKFIDAAGRYIYDTAGKVDRALNITGASHAKAAEAYRKSAVRNTYKANQARSSDYIKKYGTATSNREYNYRSSSAASQRAAAEQEENKYKSSLKYRTLRAVNTIKLSKPYKAAKKAVTGAYDKLKNSKFAQGISNLIEKGKRQVRIFLANNPLLQKMRADKVTNQFKADQDKMNAEYKRKKQRKGLASTHKDKRYRTESRGITPLGRTSSGSASYIMKNH